MKYSDQKTEITSNVRVASESFRLSDYVQHDSAGKLSTISRANLNKDGSVFVAEVQLTGSEPFEEAINKTVTAAAEVSSSYSWPPDAAISIWMTLTSSKEFVGVVIQKQIAVELAKLGIDFVLSIYCDQRDME